MGHEEQSVLQSEPAKPKAAVKAKLMHSTSLFTIEAATKPSATQVEQWEILAKYVPAVSSASGKVASVIAWAVALCHENRTPAELLSLKIKTIQYVN